MFQFNVCPGNVERWWSVASDVMNVARSRHQAALMSPWIYQLLSQVCVCECVTVYVPIALAHGAHVVNRLCVCKDANKKAHSDLEVYFGVNMSRLLDFWTSSCRFCKLFQEIGLAVLKDRGFAL